MSINTCTYMHIYTHSHTDTESYRIEAKTILKKNIEAILKVLQKCPDGCVLILLFFFSHLNIAIQCSVVI